MSLLVNRSEYLSQSRPWFRLPFASNMSRLHGRNICFKMSQRIVDNWTACQTTKNILYSRLTDHRQY